MKNSLLLSKSAILKSKYMVPNSISVLKITIEEVDVLPYITWKDGNFMFQNESLESVMNKLARWYDLDVFYLNEQTKNIHLSGMMTRYKEVSELFHYFEKISTARFIIKGRTVTVK